MVVSALTLEVRTAIGKGLRSDCRPMAGSEDSLREISVLRETVQTNRRKFSGRRGDHVVLYRVYSGVS